jgi:hypothetical protein
MDMLSFGEFQPFSACIGGDAAMLTTKWRRERDSNPRSPFRLSGFQDRLFQPLTHPSTAYYRRLAGNRTPLRYLKASNR